MRRSCFDRSYLASLLASSSENLFGENSILNDVTLTSSLRSVVQVVIAHFIFFSYLKCQDKLCQKLQKFVELCQNYAQNTSGSIFSGHCVVYLPVHLHSPSPFYYPRASYTDKGAIALSRVFPSVCYVCSYKNLKLLTIIRHNLVAICYVPLHVIRYW